MFQKCKRRKWKGKRGSSSINPLEITLARGVGSCNNRMKSSNNGHFLFVYTSVIRNGFEWSEHRSLIFGKQGPFCTLVSASWPRDTCTAACYVTRDGECAATTVLKAEVDQSKQQLTVQVFPWKFQVLNRRQSSKTVTSDRFWQCGYRDGKTGSQGFLLNISRILSSIFSYTGSTFCILLKKYFSSSRS